MIRGPVEYRQCSKGVDTLEASKVESTEDNMTLYSLCLRKMGTGQT